LFLNPGTSRDFLFSYIHDVDILKMFLQSPVRTAPSLAFILISLACGSCNERDNTLFVRIHPDNSGVDFVNENHETERSNILTYEYFYNGGGAAIGDINNDGFADIYFTSNSFENKLYLNKGNFSFEDITRSSGTVCDKGWKTGVTMADVNADGLLDIYVCRSASPDQKMRRNILYINNGNLTFTDKADEFNLDDDSFSTQASFFDFDRDGDLDCFLLNHSLLEISNSFDITNRDSKKRFPYVGNKLLRNDKGSFIDVSDSVQIYGPSSNFGLGVSIADINNDGWMDIYSGCDYTGRDKLLLNHLGKRFIDVTQTQLSHISKFTMGTDVADVNGDGHMDIFTLDMLPEDNYRQKQLMGADKYDVFRTMVKNGLHAQYMRNMFHLNNGDSTFSEIGQLAGISNTDWSWSALINDFNNDGIADIFVSNGFKRDLTDNDFAKFNAQQEIQTARRSGKQLSTLSVISKFKENKMPNYFFEGKEDFIFSNKCSEVGLGEPLITNGAAYGDLDNDGDTDLVLNNMNEKAAIYKNTSDVSGRHYLSVHLTGKGKNTKAIGSRVAVYAAGKIFVKELMPVRGFQSSVDYPLNFGLGNINHIDSVVVKWPTGNYSTIPLPRVDSKLEIDEGTVRSILREDADPSPTWFSRTKGTPFVHKENEFNDFNIQPLLPQMYSRVGPALASGDVNGDSLDDLFVGGGIGQPSTILIQKTDNQFGRQIILKTDSFGEPADAVFFDMDGDKDNDLYVVTGGNEFNQGDQRLADLLYRNDGKGNFSLQRLPEITESGSCVRPADVDNDGDIDLFVGGRIKTGRYPESPSSYILLNDGKGNFRLDQQRSLKLENIGMVTDATWVDIDKDHKEDLIIVGEWMPVTILINEGATFVNKTDAYLDVPSRGLWNCIVAGDFDADGDQDFIAGNLGLNNQMKISTADPATLYYGDFDENGSVDPLLTYRIGTGLYPYASRDELVEQLPSFKKRFRNYSDYSKATIDHVLTPSEMKGLNKLNAEILESCYIENTEKALILKRLPTRFQFSPIFSIQVSDVNHDGKLDVICGGNLSATRARSGKLTGNTGLLAFGDGAGGFKVCLPEKTGLKLTVDVRRLLFAGQCLIAGVNNDSLRVYSINSSAGQ
jgi:enediyne biosynthesis protein E4